MISSGRAEPAAVARRGRPTVVVMAVEGFEPLKEVEVLGARMDKKNERKKPGE